MRISPGFFRSPADFCGEWMMLRIASRVQSQDLPCRAGRRQREQHRQNRRRPDSRAEQHLSPSSQAGVIPPGYSATWRTLGEFVW
jgi:hypothetical protein